MTKRHLFSLNAPANWPIERKKNIWITRPNPGPHPLNKCLPISILLKQLLRYARTAREVRTILNSGDIIIDNKVRKDYRFPVGIMDSISIKKTDENFRLFINEDNKYQLNKINKDEIKLKPCKIINKRILKKGKIQLNLYDGKNILVDKDSYKVGDTIIIDLEKKQIINHLKLAKGATIYLTAGKYIGHIGKLNDSFTEKGMQPNKIEVIKGKEKFVTLKDYAFVVPEDLFKWIRWKILE